jgi:hypothetical protein
MAFRRSRVRSPSAPYFLFPYSPGDARAPKKKYFKSMKKTAVLLGFIFFFLQAIRPSALSIHDLKKIVVQIGNLTFKEELPVRYISKSKLEKVVLKIFDQEYNDESAQKDSFFLYAMGFSDQKMNLKRIRKRILINNIGGLYNEKTKALFALEEYRNMNSINALVVIHELRHAIQDQYYDLSRLLGGNLSDYDDRRLAVLSAIEGDATLVMVQFSGFSPELLTSYNADALMSFSPVSNLNVLYNYPEIVRHQLLMPYIEGLKFSNFILNKKKWKGVNTVLDDPPVSSEQILHPEKYLKKEMPVNVNIVYLPAGYQPYHSGVIGEFYLNILLKGEGEYRDLAAGWGGDTFCIFTKPSHYVLAWESVWDQGKDASRFWFDFKRFLENRFLVTFKSGNKKGSPFIAGDSKYGYFFLRLFENKVFYVRTNDRKEMNTFINRGYYD